MVTRAQRPGHVLVEGREVLRHARLEEGDGIRRAVADRGRFYDRTGALVDMIQSHLLQVLSLVAMEPPSRLDARDIRDGGGNGSIIGRNTFQRSREDALAMLDKLIGYCEARRQFELGLFYGAQILRYDRARERTPDPWPTCHRNNRTDPMSSWPAAGPSS